MQNVMDFWDHELRVAGRQLKQQIKLALHARKFQQERLIVKSKSIKCCATMQQRLCVNL